MSENKPFETIPIVLNTPINEINDQSNPETIMRWDSFIEYVLSDETESAFNVSVIMEEALEIKNVWDFKKILKEKDINFE